MIKLLNLFSNDAELRIAYEAVEAFACFMFDQRKLLNCSISVDRSDFESVGQAHYKFSGMPNSRIDIHIKVDFEAATWELVFETNKRQFCILVFKDKFISQNKIEWYRLLNYWSGLLQNGQAIERNFNQSLMIVDLPQATMDWDSRNSNSSSQVEDNKKQLERLFESLLLTISSSFIGVLDQSFCQPYKWVFRCWNSAKYGYCLCFRDIEIRILVRLDRLRLSVFLNEHESMWLDLPPETLNSMTKNFESAIARSFKIQIEN
tara:strand:- start:573 stop:1358 length:786 start_codon:yes stop_codon:yes gene_type:complete